MTGEVLMGAVAGALLAAFYLGGLALTVQRLPHASHPGALLLASFAVRALVIVAALLLLARHSLPAFAVAFVVFILTRIVVVWLSARRATAVVGD